MLPKNHINQDKRKKVLVILHYLNIFCFSLLFCNQIFAEKYFFKNYTVKDGLPQSDITDIIQDSRGFIWFSMETGGVARFDGYNVETFSREDGLPDITIKFLMEDSNGIICAGGMGGVAFYNGKDFYCPAELEFLKDDIVYTAFHDSRGVIWFGTLYGVVKFDGERCIRLTEKEGLSRYHALSVCEDKNGDIWIGTNYGLNRYDGKIFTKFYKKDGLPGDQISCLETDDNGSIWIGTSSGICVFRDNVFREIKIPALPEKSSIKDIYKDSKEFMWVATSDYGVFKIRNGIYDQLNVSRGMASNNISAVFEDRWGNLWFGSPECGAMVFSGKLFTLLDSKDGLGCDNISAVYQSKNGNYWFGSKKYGICRFSDIPVSGAGEAKQPMTCNPLCMTEDSMGNLYIGTHAGVMMFDGRILKKIPGIAETDNITAIYSDIEDNIWIGTSGKTLTKLSNGNIETFDRDSGPSDTRILSIFQDKAGTIWFGSYDRLIEHKNGIFIDHPVSGGVIGDYIFDIEEDGCSNLWLGTRGGIVRFNPYENDPGNSWKRFDKTPGLRDESLKSITVNDNGKTIWAATSRGLDKLELDSNCNLREVKNYNEESFIDIDCYQKTSFVDNSENIWFGTSKGAVKLNTAELQKKAYTPLTYITGIRINFEEQDLDPFSNPSGKNNSLPLDLRLPSNKNHITFDFVGISFPFTERTKYSYKLKGIDKEWSPPTTERFATYPQLPPGKYTFMLVSGQRTVDITSTPVEFSFEILPPFWKTRWFYFIASLSVLMAILAIIKFRTYSLSQQRDILQKEVKQRTQELISAKESLETKVLERTSELQMSKEQLRSLASEFALAEEKERRRISEGLHDSVSHNLAAAKIQLGVLGDILTEDDQKEFCENAQYLIEDALRESRSLTFELSPPVLYEIGLESAIEWLVEEMNSKHKINFRFHGTENPVSLKTDLSIPLFKAVRELMINIIKHSGASEAFVKVDAGENLQITVKDNGKGFDTGVLTQKNRKFEGFGLFNLKDRADYLGWDLLITSQPGKGTEVIISVPLKSNI